MRVCGITAEYNPFHKGHAYQLAMTQAQCPADITVAVMSGNFVQRGEPAVLDKWTRAEAAVRNGVDIVFELPYIYAVQSAGPFSHGALSLLKQAGITDLSFGSECGNLENLQEIAATPINPDHLRESLRNGKSYPQAYSLLTTTMEPNDILAVCYLKEIAGTGIHPVLIPRTGRYNSDELNDMPSAMAIRSALRNGTDPGDTTVLRDALLNNEHVYFEDYYPYLRQVLLLSSAADLSRSLMVTEGIENHLKKAAEQSDTAEEFLHNAVNWRYTASRIRRTCLHIMTQTTKEEVRALEGTTVLRILAFNDSGRRWLKELRRRKIPVASRFAAMPEALRRIEYRSTLLYASCFSKEERKRILQAEIEGAHYIRTEGESV